MEYQHCFLHANVGLFKSSGEAGDPGHWGGISPADGWERPGLNFNSLTGWEEFSLVIEVNL